MRQVRKTKVTENVRARRRLREGAYSRVEIYERFLKAWQSYDKLYNIINDVNFDLNVLISGMEDNSDMRREGTARELKEAVSDFEFAYNKLGDVLDKVEVTVKRKR